MWLRGGEMPCLRVSELFKGGSLIYDLCPEVPVVLWLWLFCGFGFYLIVWRIQMRIRQCGGWLCRFSWLSPRLSLSCSYESVKPNIPPVYLSDLEIRCPPKVSEAVSGYRASVVIRQGVFPVRAITGRSKLTQVKMRICTECSRVLFFCVSV